MLHRALEFEVEGYLERHRDARDENGHALVTHNGKARPRKVTIGSGTMEVTAPRVRDERLDEDGDFAGSPMVSSMAAATWWPELGARTQVFSLPVA